MQKSNMPPQRSLWLMWRWLVFASMLALAGCSSLRLAYDHGDTLLYWWIDGYVDLDAEQKPWVKKDIDGLFQWHRKTQLHDYPQLLQTAQRQLQGNPTAADLAADYDEVRSRTQLLLFKALPELADLARSLKPEQIAQMEKKFNANNAEFRKKNMKGDKEAQQKYRYKKSMEQFELWFGNFTSDQEALIRKASDARPLDNEFWLNERMRRQRNIVNVVKKVQSEKLSKDATMALIHGLIKDSFEPPQQPDRRQFIDTYTDSTIQLVLAVVHSATPAQKSHALKRMQGWIDDFNNLAGEPR